MISIHKIFGYLRLLREKNPDLAVWPKASWDSLRAPRRVSPLTLRILAVNMMALALLGGSILYLGRYQARLIESEVSALQMQARLSASAIAEGAVVLDQDEKSILSPLLARLMIRRLVEISEARMRLFDVDGALLADSRVLLNIVDKTRGPSPNRPGDLRFLESALGLFGVVDGSGTWSAYALYPERDARQGHQYEIVRKAKNGEEAAQIWRREGGGLLLSVAVPVQRYHQVLGVLMLTRPDTKIDNALYEERMEIVKIFGISLGFTIFFSFYLAHTISGPIKRLSKSADAVRSGQAKAVGLTGAAGLLKKEIIPDFSGRNDEIGDLSVALRDMTSSLGERIGAIENFAADVAHEIKNPLTSLRSAVETAAIVHDPERQKKLMQVIRDDVDRLDRLITDISKASRLDAELTRDETETIDLHTTIEALIDFYNTFRDAKGMVRLMPESDKGLKVAGVEERLVQVMQNLIDNALSFSPQGASVDVILREMGNFAEMAVEDKGPGIPEGKLEAVFDRFYSERPNSEKFGTHSGLGLSISKQIVQAHRGAIRAENRKDETGKIIGARFLVRLPLLRTV